MAQKNYGYLLNPLIREYEQEDACLIFDRTGDTGHDY